MLQDYLTCGGNVSDNIDFFSLNSYEWCGEVCISLTGLSYSFRPSVMIEITENSPLI